MNTEEDIKLKRYKSIRRNIRNGYDSDNGDNTRVAHYEVPKEYEKRFKIFMNEISHGYYYISTYSQKYGIIDSKYFSIKCNAFVSYITDMNIISFSEKRVFLKFLRDVTDYEPPLLRNWDKKDYEIYEENELTRKAVSKICNKYIRDGKIKKILK